MKKQRKNISLKALQTNAGQLKWLPKNPRKWTQEEIEKTTKSILEDPDFLDDRPILVVPKDDTFVIFGGNLRTRGAMNAGLEQVPCVIYIPETEDDQLAIKRRAMKDNGSFGNWDFEILGKEWGDLPLDDWGVPEWNTKEVKYEPTIPDEEREGADYDNAKLIFQFNAEEFAFVTDTLARIDASKENALLKLLNYADSEKE